MVEEVELLSLLDYQEAALVVEEVHLDLVYLDRLFVYLGLLLVH